jgi:hypothetical protein
MSLNHPRRHHPERERLVDLVQEANPKSNRQQQQQPARQEPESNWMHHLQPEAMDQVEPSPSQEELSRNHRSPKPEQNHSLE